MTRPSLAAVLVGLASLTGCPGGGARGPDAEALAALDPAVRRVAGLEVEGPVQVQSTWFKGMSVPLTLARGIRGWEVVDGHPCARLGIAVLTKEREGDVSTEWLRPAGDRLLCPARALGVERQVLDPPQPVLVAPLTPGQTWRWEGTVDGAAASVEFRVRSAGERDLEGGDRRFAVEVEQVLRAGGYEATRVQTWAEGRGLVLEEGKLPSADNGDASDVFRAWVDEPR